MTKSLPAYISSTWKFTDGILALTDTTNLISISFDNISSQDLMGNDLSFSNDQYIQMLSCSFSGESTDFDIYIINEDDITKLNTLSQYLAYEGINLLEIDQDFNIYPIRITNKLLYIYVKNDSVIDIDTLYINFKYMII